MKKAIVCPICKRRFRSIQEAEENRHIVFQGEDNKWFIVCPDRVKKKMRW